MPLSARSLLVTVAASLLIVLSVVMFEGPGSEPNRTERAPQTAATRMASIWNPSSWVSSKKSTCPFCPEKPPWEGGSCPEWCEWSPDGDDQACQYSYGHSRSCQVKTIAAPCYFVVEADTSFVNHFSCSQSTDTATCESLLKVRAESPGPCAAVNFKTCCQVDSAPWSPVPIAELWFDWSRQEGYPTNARFHSCADLPKTGHPLREGGVTSNGKPCAGH